MERLLVTGVDTILGSNLAWALSDRCEVLGLYDHLAVESFRVETAPSVANDPAEFAALLDRWNPQWIIHCDPLSAPSWDPAPLADQTTTAPARAALLAQLAESRGCPLTVVTSDRVFCGPRMFQEESAPTANPSPLAQDCLAIECALAHTAALVVRTHAYGWSCEGGAPGLAEFSLRELRAGRLPSIDGRRYATPILTTDLAELLWRAHTLRLRGLYHLAGAERTSIDRFVRELALCLGVECPQPRIRLPESTWPEECSLSSRRARRELSMPTPTLRAGLERFVAQAGGKDSPAWQFSTRPAYETVAA